MVGTDGWNQKMSRLTFTVELFVIIECINGAEQQSYTMHTVLGVEQGSVCLGGLDEE